MAVGSEGNAGLIVEDMRDRHCQRLVSAIGHIFRLLSHTGILFVHAFLISSLQKAQFIVCQRQFIICISIGAQPEQFFNVSQDCLKRSLVLLICRDIIAVKSCERNLLAIKQGKIGVIIRTGKTDGQSARLMVSRDQDQSFPRMLFCEVNCHLHGISHGQSVMDR